MAGYFEGWYFKHQAGREMIAFIPAVHTADAGQRTGSLQVITPDQSWYIPLPGEAIRIERQPHVIRAGDSTFTKNGLDLNINSDGLVATGHLEYAGLTAPRGDIMGPYRLIPFMECRHSVFSMTHPLCGSVTVNGRVFDFSDGVGYMEGDRGRSFPKRYVWAQCNWNDDGPCSLMISAADVSPLGRHFFGVIGFVLLHGSELRLATYRGAKVVSAGDGTLIVRQGEYTLTAQLLENRARELRAPSSGAMVRLVKEGLACRARLTLTEKTTVIFDFITEQASFEYEI